MAFLRRFALFSASIRNLMLCTTAVAMISGCAILDKKDSAEESNWLIRQFEKDGNAEAAKATVAYSHGDFKKAEEYSLAAIKANPRNQQALLVGALTAEKLGRWNRARQYYEDLIVIDGNETSILGSKNSTVPEKITQIAKARLRAISVKQSKLVIENNKFDITPEASKTQSKTAIQSALKKNNPKKARPAIDNVFTANEQNAISRFLVLKELAENDYVSKEEFLTRRNANIGALLPLTKQAPDVDIVAPVPSPDLIVERLQALREGVESRAITPREFAAEREIIVEALMNPYPRSRMKPKAPSKNILDAAKDLRKLEIIYDLNLITSGERAAEKKAIEKYLGIHKEEPKPEVVVAPKPVEVETPSAAQPVQPVATEVITTVEEVPVPLKTNVNTVTQNGETVALITKSETVTTDAQPQNIVPAVTSPF